MGNSLRFFSFFARVRMYAFLGNRGNNDKYLRKMRKKLEKWHIFFWFKIRKTNYVKNIELICKKNDDIIKERDKCSLIKGAIE